MQKLFSEPSLKQLVKIATFKEARHDVFEPSLRMRDLSLQQVVWEHVGVAPRLNLSVNLSDPDR